MERLFVTTYRYREGLHPDGYRELTKKFAEVGNTPGTIAHYALLDGRGGFVVRRDSGDDAEVLQIVLEYLPWVEFETHPVTTMEEAFPVIQSVYG